MNMAIAPAHISKPETIKRDARWHTEWNLENWARYMKGLELPEGLPEEGSGGVQCYTSEDLHNEEEYEKLDARLAEHTGVVVAALPACEMSAILHRYIGNKQYEFWRFNLSYGEALEAALVMVEDGLKKKGVWLGQ